MAVLLRAVPVARAVLEATRLSAHLSRLTAVAVVRAVRTLRLQPEVVEVAVVLVRAPLALARLSALVGCLQVLAPALICKASRALIQQEPRIMRGQAVAVAVAAVIQGQAERLVDRCGAVAAVVLAVIAPQPLRS